MNNWYEIVSSTKNISQGDILFNCPIFVPDFPNHDLSASEWNELEAIEFDTIVLRGNVIVLTQACDLEVRQNANAPKMETVTVAALQDVRTSGVGKGSLSSISKLNKSELYLLDPSFEDVRMGYQIVRFDKLFNLPWKLLNAFSSTQGSRLRLKSPYLEQLLQHFGMHFGRVALPENREEIITDFFSYKSLYDEQRKNHEKTWNQLTDDEMFEFIEKVIRMKDQNK